jgi:hypothetical protein
VVGEHQHDGKRAQGIESVDALGLHAAILPLDRPITARILAPFFHRGPPA